MLNVQDKIFRVKNIFREQALILMYHRIGKADADPWQLSVSEENFEKQLGFLKRKYSVISLPTLLEQVKNNRLKPKEIAITFDDGYADNYFTAVPLLTKYQLPATFFITSKNIGLQKEFWWDELAKILLLTPQLPKEFSLSVNGKSFDYDLQNETFLTEEMRQSHDKYIAFEQGSRRAELYCKVWEILTPLNDEAQENFMERIRTWAGIGGEARPGYCCMTKGNIAEIASIDLFTIGSHTATHPALAYHNKEVQQKEILNNINFLKDITEERISLFAYPSGNYNEDTIDLISLTNLEGAVTTKGRRITTRSGPFELGRFQVNDWDEKKLGQKLFSWFKYEDL